MDPLTAKEQLRAWMRRARANVSQDERTRRAASSVERLLALPEVRAARTTLLFYSFGSELGTAELSRQLKEAGSRVLLPRLTPAGMEAAEADTLAPSGYGPKEPTGPAVDPEDIDLVVVPGLAFDATGRRLGYGGGHYDRFFPLLSPSAVRVGLAFAFQLVEEVPAEPWDEPVHIIVTDEGVIDARGGG